MPSSLLVLNSWIIWEVINTTLGKTISHAIPGVFKRKEWFGKNRIQCYIKEIFILNTLEEIFGANVLISSSELPINSFYSVNNFLILQTPPTSPRLYNFSKSTQLSKCPSWEKRARGKEKLNLYLNFSFFLSKNEKYFKGKG